MLEALNIPSIKYHIAKQRTGLLKHVWMFQSAPYTKPVIEPLILHIAIGIVIEATLVGELVESEISPETLFFNLDQIYVGSNHNTNPN